MKNSMDLSTVGKQLRLQHNRSFTNKAESFGPIFWIIIAILLTIFVIAVIFIVVFLIYWFRRNKISTERFSTTERNTNSTETETKTLNSTYSEKNAEHLTTTFTEKEAKNLTTLPSVPPKVRSPESRSPEKSKVNKMK
jgi:flagellar basal body-associated protein FliL